MIKVCALWERETRGGKVFYGGRINSALDILLFPVDNGGDSRPVFDVYLAESRQQGEGENRGRENGKQENEENGSQEK